MKVQQDPQGLGGEDTLSQSRVQEEWTNVSASKVWWFVRVVLRDSSDVHTCGVSFEVFEFRFLGSLGHCLTSVDRH